MLSLLTVSLACFNPNSNVVIRVPKRCPALTVRLFSGMPRACTPRVRKYCRHSLGNLSNSSVMSGMTAFKSREDDASDVYLLGEPPRLDPVGRDLDDGVV